MADKNKNEQGRKGNKSEDMEDQKDDFATGEQKPVAAGQKHGSDQDEMEEAGST